MDLARELRNLWNMELTVIPIVIRALGVIDKGWERGAGRFENQRMNREDSKNIIDEIGRRMLDVIRFH